MREAYQEELEALSDGLVEMANLVGSAMGLATTALLDADLQLAESVFSADAKVEDLQRDLENRAVAVLARQQPVATDLRVVVTSLRMSADLERSGALAQHVAKLVRMRHPGRAVPRDLRRTILEMGADLLRVWPTCGFVRIKSLVATEPIAADLPVCLSRHSFVRIGAEGPGVTDTA
jgi:phosphate transport system protein